MQWRLYQNYSSRTQHNTMKINQLLTVSLLLSSICLQAQRPSGGAPGAGGGPGGGAPIARVYGKVLDGSNNDPLAYASVVVKPMRKDTIAGGALTKTNGFFDIAGLMPGMYQVKISSIGYADTTFQVKLIPPTIETDAGNIRLRSNSQTLGEVTIVGEKQAVELAVDRRIYNVDRMMSATGGTAIDALKTIPAVSIDADGAVELRNSAPLIFVDGKPSQLTLAQIPASEIEKIEVITNPGARYEASAAGGIINIVLKKNKLPGIFSMLNLGVGTNDRYNGMASLNIRERPIGVSFSYNYNTGNNPAFQYNIIDRKDATTGATTTHYQSEGINASRRGMQFVRLGLDYDINQRNTITLSGNVHAMDMRFNDDQEISNTISPSKLDYTSVRTARNTRNNDTYTGQIDFKRTFPTNGHEWLSFVQYNNNKNLGDNKSIQTYQSGAGLELPTDLIQSDGGTRAETFQFQTDYIKPLGANKKIEIGGRYQHKENLTNTLALRADSAGALVEFPLLSVHYAFTEQISAAYANYMARAGKWGYQAGLRLESSIFDGYQPDLDSTFSYRFPSGVNDLQYLFFPSIFLTYTVKDGQDLQFNVSRKLERPNFFQVMPFVWQQDNQSYRAGNPNLFPEFRYVAEANHALTRPWGNFFSSLYGRYEDQPITSVVRRATDGTESLINTFINGESNTRFGLENSVKYGITKHLDVQLSLNTFRNQVKANYGGVSLDRKGVSWDTKASIEYRFKKVWVFQTNGEYEAPRVIPQGRTLPNYGMDIAIKRIFNPLGSMTLQVNDVFNSKGRGQIYEGVGYRQEVWRRREVRFIQLSAQLRFGKPDASIFKKSRNSGGRSSGGDMDF
jgi:iron complex outermembrane recepter protein